eukprot:scaffold30748_cov43-Prasinocladus_malaysianus.AAC.2
MQLWLTFAGGPDYCPQTAWPWIWLLSTAHGICYVIDYPLVLLDAEYMINIIAIFSPPLQHAD